MRDTILVRSNRLRIPVLTLLSIQLPVMCDFGGCLRGDEGGPGLVLEKSMREWRLPAPAPTVKIQES